MIGADRIRARKRGLRRFLRREDGTALVEFGISLPTILIILFAIIETSRMLFAYQAAVGGVRDAARYFGRAIPADVCDNAKWTTWVTANSPNTLAATIVGQKIGGGSVFPGAAALTGDPAVTVTRTCPTTANPAYAALSGKVPVIEVAANVRIDFPFGSIFSLFGEALGGFTTTIADTSRVLGS
jgi:Flp pilus assembly protein TadG